jgi:hypothetical protein
MGLFSSKKTIVVSSTAYNMAGDEATRPNFLKNSLYGAVMSPYNRYLGEVIVGNYLAGPAIYQRNFFRWAERQSYPGLPTYSVTQERAVDPAVVAAVIPTPGSPAGLQISMQSANAVRGEYDWIVEQYVLANYPENYDTAYTSSYNSTTNVITIQWFGGGSVTFSGGTYDPGKSYIVAEYFHYLPASLQSLVTGSTTVGALTKPSTTGYILDSSVNTGVVNYPMNYDERTITTYTGAGAPADTDITTSESDSVNFDGLDETWTKTTYEGGDGNSPDTVSRKHFLEISEYRNVYTDNTQVSYTVNPDTPSPGITQTIEVRRIGDHARPIYDWRIDTQDTILREIVGGVQVYSYEEDTGEPTLDALLEDVATTGTDAEYFPFMPIRLKNKSITHADYDDITGSGLYEKTNRAYRRAANGGQRFSKLIDEVENNPDIGDIDYAFTHHGVALNVLEPACRRYMYTWLKNVSAFQNTNSSYMAGYAVDVATYVAEVAAMNSWIYDQGDSARPQFGDSIPPTPSLVSIETTTVRLACADPDLVNLDMRVSWTNITETLHSGTPTNPDTGLAAVEGDVWFAEGTDLTWDVESGYYPDISTKTYNVENMEMYWQTGASSYKKLTIWGLVHRNYVYGGEEVKITGKEAYNDLDPTGFIIPLHYPTMKGLGLKDSTQMATANTFIIFNSYEIVKKKWYQGFIGMLIIILVIVVVSVLFPPAAGAGGLLGTNAAVGAALGLTGTAAIVAGAIVNALVAIAISQIISAGSTALFGDRLGAIIGTIINLAISMGVSSGFEFGNINDLLSTENLLKITSAIANGYEGYTQGAIAEIGDKMEEGREKYENKMDQIEDLMAKLKGNNDLNFNPLSLTDSVTGNGAAAGSYITETLDAFIHRTTMTGSDIVDINLDLVNNFSALSLELPQGEV